MNLNTISISLKKLKPKDFVYPGILICFFVIVAVIFSFATKFISLNINEALSLGTPEEVPTLNMEDYAFVAKKLNLTLDAPQKKTVTDTKASTSTPQ